MHEVEDQDQDPRARHIFHKLCKSTVRARDVMLWKRLVPAGRALPASSVKDANPPHCFTSRPSPPLPSSRLSCPSKLTCAVEEDHKVASIRAVLNRLRRMAAC